MFCLFLPAAGCSKAPATVEVEKTRPVKVQKVVLEHRPVRLHYIGTTSSESIRKLGFKVGGKLKQTFVEKGQRVKRGQKLAQLDTRDLRLAASASQYSLDKANKAYQDSLNFFDKIETLYDQKARPQLDYDRAKLNRDVSAATVEQARVDYRLRRSMLSDCTLQADMDGYVVDVLSKPGEMVGAGYPLVLVRTEQQLVNVGVSQRDVKEIVVGTKAQVKVDDAEGEGKVVNISQIPDTQSRTYNVEVELVGPLAENEFYIGSIARVAFEVGDSEGIWIPIQSIMTDGANYVYTMEESRAVRKNLELEGTSETYVEVTGISEGAEVIVEGMKNLKEGYKVAVQ